MGYTLTDATYSDISGLVQEVIDTGAFVARTTDDEPFVVEAAEIFAGDPGFHIFALVSGESRPIGFAMVVPGEDPATLDVGPTYVTNELRGQGLGRDMVAQVIEWARQRGAHRLVVATWGANARARHVFESVGFSFTSEELDARVNGDSTVRYELELSHPFRGEHPATRCPSA